MVYLTFEKESLLAVFMTNLISYSDFYRFLIFLKQNFIKFLLLFSLTKPLWYFYQPYAAAPLGNQDLSFHQTAIWLVSKITNQKPYALLCIGLGKTNCYYQSSYNSRVLFAFLYLSIKERFKRMASVRTVL